MCGTTNENLREPCRPMAASSGYSLRICIWGVNRGDYILAIAGASEASSFLLLFGVAPSIPM
jgi:hypothetical protein